MIYLLSTIPTESKFRIHRGCGFQPQRLIPRMLRLEATATGRVPLRFCSTLALCFFALFAKTLHADEATSAQQFVNATTIVVAKIDSKRLALPDNVTTKLANSAELQRGTKSVTKVIQEVLVALNGETVFAAVDVPFSQAQTPLRLYVKNAPGFDSKKLFGLLEPFQFTKPIVQGEYVCFSMIQPTESTNKFAIAENVLSAARADLKIAMQSVQDFPIQLLVLPPEYLWATFRDLMPSLPKQFGGGATSLLTDGVRWSAIGIDPAKLQLQAITQSKSPEAATALAANLPKMMTAFSNQLPAPAAIAWADKLIPLVKPTVKGDQMIVSINALPQLDQTVAMLGGAMTQMFGSMVNQVKMDRFKEISLAHHNFDSAFQVFAPNKDQRDATGKSNLSWRVHILPFIGQGELYSQFHLKEAWNSEHNLKLLEKMPEIYKANMFGLDGLNELKPGYTTFLAPVGDGTIFGETKPVRIGDITDGTSNTIWLVEVKPELAKPWTAPEDYAFDPSNPAAGLADAGSDKPMFLCAFADGSAQRVSLTLPPSTLLYLFKMNDGNIVEW